MKRIVSARAKLKKAMSAFLASAVIGGSIFGIGQVIACGPFFEEAVFHHELHPDLPLKLFAGGNLGILQPDYARSYLVVAYRHLTGKPVTPEMNKQFTLVWDSRLSASMDPDYRDYTDTWLKARKEVSETKIDRIETYKYVDYSAFLNINSDAFLTASETLKSYISKYGAKDKRTTDWVAAQDLVFAGGGDSYNNKVKPVAPEPLPESADAELRNDRDYQIASFNFYAGDFDKAIAGFRKISQDKQSRWSKLSRYLVARSIARKATLAKASSEELTEALTILKDIRESDEDKDLHEAAARLISFIRVRTEPVERSRELIAILEGDAAGADYRNALSDLTWVMDRYAPSREEDEDDDKPAPKSEPKESPLDDDLSRWVFNFQATDAASADQAFKKWKAADENHKEPWLLSLISKLKPEDSRVEEVLEAAARVKSDSAAYPTVTFHRVRLLQSRDEKMAYTVVDEILRNNGEKLPPSARNLLSDQKLGLCKTFEEFASLIEARPAEIAWDNDVAALPDGQLEDYEKKDSFTVYPARFTKRAALLINKKLPLSAMEKLATHKSIGKDQQLNIVQAAWTRAVLLKDEKAASRLTAQLIALRPQMKNELTAYAASKDPALKDFLAIDIILKNPAMNPYVRAGLPRQSKFDEIDSYRDNWWCDDELKDDNSRISCLSSAELTQAATEYKKLIAMGTAPNLLVDRVMAYYAVAPKDARLAEALHLAVRSTRYGCTNDKTTQYSKKAFQALHKGFPKNPWTAKTPYWF
ncbi:MAG: hypothetical protein R3F51_01585 [Cyanobacteriota/Melainabacteria group bacterium]